MPEIDQLIIEVVADTTQFEPAIDQLEKLGAVDSKSADLIRKTNADLAARNKQLEGMAAGTAKATKEAGTLAASFEKAGKSISGVASNLATGATSTAIQQFTQKVKQAFETTGKVAQVTAADVKATGVSFQELSKIITQTFQNNQGIEQTSQKVVSLRTELRNLKAQLAGGELSDEDFIKLSARAAELEDRIGDVNLQIRNMASDTRNLDGSIQAIQGVTGAFQVAEGASALFGVSLGNMQEVQLRLVALLNVSNGLQQIQNLLQKESAAVGLVVNAQLKARNLSIAAENALQSKSVVVRGLATAAQWALNAAMTANPIGIVIVALASLAAALLYFTNTAETAAEKQAKLNDLQLESLKTLELLDKTFTKVSDDRIRLMDQELTLSKARGDSAIEIARQEKAIADERLKQALTSQVLFEKEVQGIGNLTEEYTRLIQKIQQLKAAREDEDDDEQIALLEQQLTIVEKRIAIEEKLRNDAQKARTDQRVAEENILKAQKDAEDKRLEAIKKREEAERAARLNRLQEEKAIIELGLLEAEKGSETEILLQRALFQNEAKIALLALEGQKDIEEQKELIRAQAREKDKQATLNAEREKIEAVIALQQQLNTTDISSNNARLAQAEKDSLEELRIKQDGIELAADAEKLAAQQKFILSQKSLADQREYEEKIREIDAETNAAKEKEAEEYYAKLDALRKKELDAEKKAREEKEALQKLAYDTAVATAYQASQSIVDNDHQKTMQNINDNLSAQLDAIDKEMQAELNNENLTEKQKAAIREKFYKQEAAAKLAAWEAQQNALVSQAIMQAGLAVINTLASIPYPANLIAAASIAALAAVEVAQIESQEPPKFAKGTEYVKGPGTKTSDSIIARISVGERIISADTSQEYAPALNRIQRREIPARIANKMIGEGMMPERVSFRLKPVTEEMEIASRNQGFQFDYQKAAQAYADAQWSDLDDNTDAVREVVSEIRSLPSRMPKNPPPKSLRYQ